MSKKITIAVDGPASSGKSTLAKDLAKTLGYVYINSGSMYRAVTHYFIENNIDIQQPQAVANALQNIDLQFVAATPCAEKQNLQLHTNGINVEPYLRQQAVNNMVSAVAALAPVRQFLVAQQQQLGKNGGVAMDGRDIGTVVFPNAELKIYLTASVEVRAQRRFDEIERKGNAENQTYLSILANIKQRDNIDSTRAITPLKVADDAIVIDNSQLSRNQQLQKALSYAEALINQ